MNNDTTAALFTIEEWDEAHPRWAEFVRCLEETAPEQAPFVLGEYARHLPCHLLVAVKENQVVGFLRFGVQAIGAEEDCPPLTLEGVPLTEAKIHAYAVREERCGHGIGTALQRRAIAVARDLGCHQLSSHSSYERAANCRVKLSLGFCALPERQGSIRFLMPLRAVQEDERTRG
jgi:GNAT superfamily N-acetyltransferase